MKTHALLTGATGLVGTYLFRDLQLAGTPLAVLVRPDKKRSVTERVADLLDLWARQGSAELPMPYVISGDLHQPMLGVSEEDQQWLRENCRSVVHSGASVSFRPTPDGEPWRTNVEGTRQLLRLCQATNILDFHLVSTAYVCGARAGIIREVELDVGQDFRNEYEQSKLQAEKLVREATFLRRPTIYRPPFIAGDSQSGFTTTYHGLFHYLRLMALIVPSQEPGADGIRRVPVRLHCTGQEKRNCVPIDWVSAVVTRLFHDPLAHGNNFHLASNHRITPQEVIDFTSSYYNSTGVQFGEQQVVEPNEFEELAQTYLDIYQAYESLDPDFDTTNLQKFAGDLICPAIDEPMLHRFIRFGEQNRWGKGPRRTRNEWAAEPVSAG